MGKENKFLLILPLKVNFLMITKNMVNSLQKILNTKGLFKNKVIYLVDMDNFILRMIKNTSETLLKENSMDKVCIMIHLIC